MYEENRPAQSRMVRCDQDGGAEGIRARHPEY